MQTGLISFWLVDVVLGWVVPELGLLWMGVFAQKSCHRKCMHIHPPNILDQLKINSLGWHGDLDINCGDKFSLRAKVGWHTELTQEIFLILTSSWNSGRMTWVRQAMQSACRVLPREALWNQPWYEIPNQSIQSCDQFHTSTMRWAIVWACTALQWRLHSSQQWKIPGTSGGRRHTEMMREASNTSDGKAAETLRPIWTRSVHWQLHQRDKLYKNRVCHGTGSIDTLDTEDALPFAVLQRWGKAAGAARWEN